MNKDSFVKELSKIRCCATFLTVSGYRNEYSEIADYNIIFHMNYQNALIKSIEVMKSYQATNDLELQAKQELLKSFNCSLSKLLNNPIELRDDGYTHFEVDGKIIKGAKLHLDSNTLHLYGLQVYKRILIPGNYPPDNRKPLTLIKNNLKKLTPIGKFRQFKICADRVDHISVEKLILTPPV